MERPFHRLTPELSGAAGKPRYEEQTHTPRPLERRVRLWPLILLLILALAFALDLDLITIRRHTRVRYCARVYKDQALMIFALTLF